MNIYVNVSGGGRQSDGADVTFTWDPTYLSVTSIAAGTGFNTPLYAPPIGANSARFASGLLCRPAAQRQYPYGDRDIPFPQRGRNRYRYIIHCRPGYLWRRCDADVA